MHRSLCEVITCGVNYFTHNSYIVLVFGNGIVCIYCSVLSTQVMHTTMVRLVTIDYILVNPLGKKKGMNSVLLIWLIQGKITGNKYKENFGKSFSWIKNGVLKIEITNRDYLRAANSLYKLGAVRVNLFRLDCNFYYSITAVAGGVKTDRKKQTRVQVKFNKTKHSNKWL